MTDFWQDLRFALRDLRKGFLVTSLAVFSLAAAIAGNTIVFGFVNALVFRPLPYPEPDRIVFLRENEEGSRSALVASAANLLDWRERNRSFTDLAGYRPAPMSLGAGDRPEARRRGSSFSLPLRLVGGSTDSRPRVSRRRRQ